MYEYQRAATKRGMIVPSNPNVFASRSAISPPVMPYSTCLQGQPIDNCALGDCSPRQMGIADTTAHRPWWHYVAAGLGVGVGYYLLRKFGIFRDRGVFSNPPILNIKYQDEGPTGHIPGKNGEIVPIFLDELSPPGRYTENQYIDECLRICKGNNDTDCYQSKKALLLARNIIAPIDWVGANKLYKSFYSFAILASDGNRLFLSRQMDLLFKIWVSLGMPDGDEIAPRAAYIISKLSENFLNKQKIAGFNSGFNSIGIIGGILGILPAHLATPRVIWQIMISPNIAKMMYLSYSKKTTIKIANNIYNEKPENLWRIRNYYNSLIEKRKEKNKIGFIDETVEEFFDPLSPKWNINKDVINLDERSFVRGYFTQGSDAWLRLFGRLPNKEYLHEQPASVIASIPLKTFINIMQSGILNDFENEIDANEAAIRLSITFGDNWKTWLSKMKDRNIDLHEATYWLANTSSPGLDRYLLDHWQAGDRRKSSDDPNNDMDPLKGISENWNYLTDEEKLLPVDMLNAVVKTKKYKDVRNLDFAIVAAFCEVPVPEYNYLETIFDNTVMKYRDNLLQDRIPHATARIGKYKIYKLPKDDPRGIFLGKYTGCCQHPFGAGSSCAKYGLESENSGFYVIESDNGRIIAQSWVWRNGPVMVFDNIEGKGMKLDNYPLWSAVIEPLYTELSEHIVRDSLGGINEVRVGWGSMSTARTHSRWKKASNIIPLPMDYEGYTDAEKQLIIAKG